MKAPKLPSFYKNQGLQGFKFTPRYYKPNARKNKNLGENHKKIKFKKISNNELIKGRNKRIIFIIIVLSLLTYYFLKKQILFNYIGHNTTIT
jgi:hypothetical protein|tara:strand:- start:233 stop:508 length:276 start_codon:yes stop_codon:yes gene_type:complete